MARVHGQATNLSFNGVAIEDELNSVTMNATVGEADITAFGDTYQNFLAGKKNVSFDVSGSLDMDFASDGDATIFDHISLTSGPKTLVFDPDGAGPATDSPEYTCTSSGLTGAICSSYTLSLDVGGVASYTASFQCSGATTRAVS